MKRTLAIIVSLLIVGQAYSQQIPLSNQYLINMYSLSPAYAGSFEHWEGYLSYRNDWAGIPGSPESKSLNLNGPLTEKMGIGAMVQQSTVGIFRNLTARATYAYHLSMGAGQSLSFGLDAGIFENHINLTNVNNGMDPVVMNQQDFSNIAFDAGFGILYRNNNLNVGVALPRLMPSEHERNDTSLILYSATTHFNIHASYFAELNRNLGVDYHVVMRQSSTSG
ncbi:MAG: PorP/SprF family type IX secretion system membrane protein, partial [Bacteroidetes bacterium]|nr:PorP/SprF family type IX secretion system membrane protein [Bacteroidota bacterium]